MCLFVYPLPHVVSIKVMWIILLLSIIERVRNSAHSPTILILYDTSAATKISADASSYGVGAVLLQHSNQLWKPVAYASRKLSDTEKCYAQIEKEALALTWKFSPYIMDNGH